MDHLVDAHEIERNKSDHRKTAYHRANYVKDNFHRYSNDTMANLMFDTKLPKCSYDHLNSVMDFSSTKFYIASTLMHFMAFAWLSYLLRYRTMNEL